MICRLLESPITVRSSPRAKLFPTLDETSARTKTKQMREAVQASKIKRKENLKKLKLFQSLG